MNTTARQPQPGQSRRACVLHAGDDRLTSAAITRLLTVKGFKVENAANGQKALGKLLSLPATYDFIITDQGMPLLTGEGWLIRAREGGFAGRVIVYAASLPDTLAARVREPGVERIVNKAESLHTLLDALDEPPGTP
jgi:DNA-binding response OmpR family regulator